MPETLHIAERVFNQPLMVDPGKLAAILSAIGPRLGLPAGQLPFAEALACARPDLNVGQAQAVLAGVPGALRTNTPYILTDRGVAVISVAGSLVHRSAAQARPMSGVRSYGEIADEYNMALADPQVRAILLCVNSGGGEVAGAFELAARIFATRGQKPVWAAADTSAFSAAYLIASAASRITLPITGAVGSVGVIAIHRDISERDRMEGVRYTAIFAGERKNDFNPHEPLSADARAILTASVERWNDTFIDAVARHRGMKAAAVRATQAGWFEGVAGRATKIGFADATMPFPEALAELTELASRPPRGAFAMGPRQGAETEGPAAAEAAAEEILAAQEMAPEGIEEKARQSAPGADRTEENRMSEVEKAARLAAEQAQGGGNVVALDAARAQGAAEAAAQTREIIALCELARAPEKAAGFIKAGTSVAQVRADLQAMVAAEAEKPGATSGQHANGGQQTAAETGAMWTAAMRRAGVPLKGEARA